MAGRNGSAMGHLSVYRSDFSCPAYREPSFYAESEACLGSGIGMTSCSWRFFGIPLISLFSLEFPRQFSYLFTRHGDIRSFSVFRDFSFRDISSFREKEHGPERALPGRVG